MKFAEYTPDVIRPLADGIAGILHDARACGHVDLFCDFDGVLAPIAQRPEDARLEEGMQNELAALARHPAFHVAVVSGRALNDVRARVGIPEITYVGNHGLEIDGPGVRLLQAIPDRAIEHIRALAGDLADALSRYSGVIVEDKGLVVAVHFRLADAALVPDILRVVERLVEARIAGDLLRLTSGKEIVEVHPNLPCDKGSAVLRILEQWRGASHAAQRLPIYIGDDQTDEDAFRALADRGVTIRVEDVPFPSTAAAFGVPAVPDVRAFLQGLLHTFDRP